MDRMLLKILLTAAIIAVVSELGKRLTWMGAILASLPLTSILAMTWLYWDTQDINKISELSIGIFWAVLPSLLFFAILPLLLKNGIRFPIAMPLSCTAMFLGYTVYVWIMKRAELM